MAFADFFKSTPAAPKAPEATPAPAAPPAQSTNEPVNPLDAYDKLFKVPDQPKVDETPKFNLDPKVLNDVSSKFDFTQGLDPQLVQKAQQGDAQSLIAMMQAVGQNAYKAAMAHGSTLTDSFVSSRNSHDMKSVGELVKKELTNNALANTPNYSHPVVKEQLIRTAESFRVQYPEATHEQIAQMAQRYIQDLAAAISPQSKEPTQNQQQGDSVDWDKYFQ